jgi:hypothetical protein
MKNIIEDWNLFDCKQQQQQKPQQQIQQYNNDDVVTASVLYTLHWITLTTKR